jgi:hypothetical protein
MRPPRVSGNARPITLKEFYQVSKAVFESWTKKDSIDTIGMPQNIVLCDCRADSIQVLQSAEVLILWH